jgi:hypothetical protein
MGCCHTFALPGAPGHPLVWFPAGNQSCTLPGLPRPLLSPQRLGMGAEWKPGGWGIVGGVGCICGEGPEGTERVKLDTR